MGPNSQLTLLIVVLFFSVCCSNIQVLAADGRWIAILPTGPYAEELGRFAVDEYNRMKNKHLIYKSVVQASFFKVKNLKIMDIHVIIKAADANVDHKYEATIHEDPWRRPISTVLTHFTKM